MKTDKKILHLPLKAKWYNMIESGEKTEEYREIKDYWLKRLLGTDAELVEFRYGYTKRTMLFEIEDLRIGYGKEEWGAPTNMEVFIIELGKRIK